MRFWEAMKALEEGKKVRRFEWRDYQYISLEGDEMGLGFIETIKNYLSKDLIQDKWELFHEPEKPKSPEEEFLDKLILMPEGQGQAIEVPAHLSFMKFSNLLLEKIGKK